MAANTSTWVHIAKLCGRLQRRELVACRWQGEWLQRKDKQSEEESQTRGVKDCLQTAFVTDPSSLFQIHLLEDGRNFC